jgi:hypothetical protein
MRSGSARGPRIWPADQLTAAGSASVNAGIRASQVSMATRVIGHGDWCPPNLYWQGPHLIAVHDWDSLICQPEPAIAGLGAASGRRWTSRDYAASWAAGLWQRVFDAKTQSLDGDPGQILTRHEAQARPRLAGLDPGLAAETPA